MNIKSFYQRQISLSEWFETFEDFDKESFRNEDNEKRERLKLLHEIIKLPFDNPTQFSAEEISAGSKRFRKFYEKHKTEDCALRLIPLDPSLPKLRLRGVSVKDVMVWYKEQNIDPSKYRCDFIPHSENAIWSTIFIVNKKGFFGEIISGMHNQLTQGFYNEEKPILFTYDFNKLKLSQENPPAKQHLKKIIANLRVRNSLKKKEIQKKLNGDFSRDFLMGYFETINTKEFGLWFIDYNRILGDKYSDFEFNIMKKDIQDDQNVLKGLVASRGSVTGRVKIIRPGKNPNTSIDKGDVLVCEMTTPEHIIHIQKVAAIVTDKGGILCHAAIVAREFGIPCIVGTKEATKRLKENDIVEVNAIEGTILILSRGAGN